MKNGTTDCNRSRLLARDSLERKQFIKFPRGIKGHSTSTIERFDENELIIACSQCSKMKKKLNQLYEEFDDQELFIQNLAIMLDMVYQKHNNLEELCSHYDGKSSYHRQRNSLKINLELRDHLKGAITQLDLLLYEASNLKTRLKTEFVRAHTQLEENTYKQQISELKEQLYKFALIEKTLNNALKETNYKLRKRKEDLKYAQSRLAEADQHTLERSDVLSKKIRDLRQRLKKSETSERALRFQLQHSREDLISTNEELKRTPNRPVKAALHAQERSGVLSQEIKDLRQRLEESESCEHALSIQLQQSRADLKSTNEELKRTQDRFREKSKPKDVEFNPLLQQAHEQVNRITRELEDTKTS
ncbi:hypothetical protein DPMN_163959 [Dreissena polymorpha]|uniref:Uncharacterized protein n=1 Tax=Dreissena polymorpha TaxID=45954 RepID=A0A9D4EU99_DREPO|nr:hypothetical protein DPMN_163959 [Dreissena polymorpha]